MEIMLLPLKINEQKKSKQKGKIKHKPMTKQIRAATAYNSPCLHHR